MPEKILEYSVIEFPSAVEATTTAAKITAFVGSRDGVVWATDPNRAVIWDGPAMAKEGTLYVSAGALKAAEAAGLSLHPSGAIPVTELPVDRALLYGHDSDQR